MVEYWLGFGMVRGSNLGESKLNFIFLPKCSLAWRWKGNETQAAKGGLENHDKTTNWMALTLV